MRQPVTYILKICYRAFDDFINRTQIPALERSSAFRLSIDTTLLEQLYDILKYCPYILEILGKYHCPDVHGFLVSEWVPCSRWNGWKKCQYILCLYTKVGIWRAALSHCRRHMYPKANRCDAVGIIPLNLSFEFLSIIMPLTVDPHSTATRNCHIISYLNGTVMLCGDYSSNIMGIGT